MGYESGKTYWIVPQNDTGVALSVYGNTAVSENRNVVVWSKQDIADQFLCIKQSQIKCKHMWHLYRFLFTSRWDLAVEETRKYSL